MTTNGHERFLDKGKPLALMSRVRNRGTAAERHVRRAVWDSGFRYRLNVRKLPATPDLVLSRYRTVVLVQGCFWPWAQLSEGTEASGNQ